MQILVVAATAAEVAPLSEAIRLAPSSTERVRQGRHGGHEIDLLVTGVGMVSTAAWCARTLARDRYDLALNVGLCGAFDRNLPLGSVVHVVSDRLAELGAEDGDAFLTVYELGLLGRDEPPFRDGAIVNPMPPANAALERLPRVAGITVNTVHGRDSSIAAVRQRCDPQVETMEGAAFMYACLIRGMPFAEIRAVSNVVEKRNRAAWKLDEAIGNLNAAALRIIDQT